MEPITRNNVAMGKDPDKMFVMVTAGSVGSAKHVKVYVQVG